MPSPVAYAPSGPMGRSPGGSGLKRPFLGWLSRMPGHPAGEAPDVGPGCRLIGPLARYAGRTGSWGTRPDGDDSIETAPSTRRAILHSPRSGRRARTRSGRGAAWQRAAFGTLRSRVQIPPSRPERRLGRSSQAAAPVAVKPFARNRTPVRTSLTPPSSIGYGVCHEGSGYRAFGLSGR